MNFRRIFARYAYFMGLLSFLTWIGNSIAGGFAYSQADGLVVGDSGAISPEYTVTVLDIPVQNGQKVKKGDIVARVSSSRVAELTARLSADSSSLVSKMAEIRARASMIDQLVGSAEERDRILTDNRKELESIQGKGYLPLLTANAVIDQVFKGKEELAILMAEKDTMSRQVAQVVAASRFTDQALDDLATLYDAGRMKAPMDGYIAGINASIGSVMNPGDIIADMVGERAYVLAYFPISRLYELHEGEPMTVEIGISKWLHGTVRQIMPIAAKLPKEFQGTLSPVDRQQLVRIDFDEGVRPPPFFTKVTVR
jgi:multidrug resistance efflux pump